MEVKLENYDQQILWTRCFWKLHDDWISVEAYHLKIYQWKGLRFLKFRRNNFLLVRSGSQEHTVFCLFHEKKTSLEVLLFKKNQSDTRILFWDQKTPYLDMKQERRADDSSWRHNEIWSKVVEKIVREFLGADQQNSSVIRKAREVIDGIQVLIRLVNVFTHLKQMPKSSRIYFAVNKIIFWEC